MKVSLGISPWHSILSQVKILCHVDNQGQPTNVMETNIYFHDFFISFINILLIHTHLHVEILECVREQHCIQV